MTLSTILSRSLESFYLYSLESPFVLKELGANHTNTMSSTSNNNPSENVGGSGQEVGKKYVTVYTCDVCKVSFIDYMIYDTQ